LYVQERNLFLGSTVRKKREKRGEVECAKVDLRKNVKKGKGDRRK